MLSPKLLKTSIFAATATCTTQRGPRLCVHTRLRFRCILPSTNHPYPAYSIVRCKRPATVPHAAGISKVHGIDSKIEMHARLATETGRDMPRSAPSFGTSSVTLSSLRKQIDLLFSQHFVIGQLGLLSRTARSEPCNCPCVRFTVKGDDDPDRLHRSRFSTHHSKHSGGEPRSRAGRSALSLADYRRAADRMRWAEQMHNKGYVSKAQFDREIAVFRKTGLSLGLQD